MARESRLCRRSASDFEIANQLMAQEQAAERSQQIPALGSYRGS